MNKLVSILVLLLIAFGCADNPADNPENKQVSYEVLTYRYDQKTRSWNQKPDSVLIVKSIPGKSLSRYCLFADIYGNNWCRSLPDESNGSIVEVILKDSNPLIKSSYQYYPDNYLYSVYDSIGDKLIHRKEYSVENGKLNLITDFDASAKSIYIQQFFYSSTGHVETVNHYDLYNNKFIHEEYQYNKNESVSKISSSYRGDIYFTYDSLGFLVEEKRNHQTTTYKYNSSHQMTEMDISVTANYKYTYNTDGRVIECIAEYKNGEKFKAVYKY